jgi:very-short-patch-repair endonuclease
MNDEKKDWAEFSRTMAQTKRAQLLRREATPPERILWTKLNRRQLGWFKFRRQHPIGPYTLDFYCPAVGLCVELDGGTHGEDEQIRKDAIRTAYLEKNGVFVLRFRNEDVRRDPVRVADAILDCANNLERERRLFPLPLERGG